MFPNQLRRGAFIDGKRIVSMAPARRSHLTGVLVTVAGGVPTFYRNGIRVPGTLPRTNFLAGPVGAGRGTRSTGAGWRDGEDRRDRHSRLIDNIVYA